MITASQARADSEKARTIGHRYNIIIPIVDKFIKIAAKHGKRFVDVDDSTVMSHMYDWRVEDKVVQKLKEAGYEVEYVRPGKNNGNVQKFVITWG